MIQLEPRHAESGLKIFDNVTSKASLEADYHPSSYGMV